MKKMFTKLLLLFVLFLSSIEQSHAANYYWVGGAGNWSDLTHWATTSGGTTFHIIVPSPNDDVIFDANSGFTTGNNTVTSNSSIYCRNMTWNNAPANPIFAESDSYEFFCYQSLTLQPSVVFNARVYFTGSTPGMITSNGAWIRGAIEIDKAGSSITQADDLFLHNGTTSSNSGLWGNIILTQGTFDLNENDAYANCFYSSNNFTRHLDISNAIMWLKSTHLGLFNNCTSYLYPGITSSTSYGFQFTGTNKTVSAANSTIRQSQGCNGFNISGGTQLTFNNLWFDHPTAQSYSSTLGNNIYNIVRTSAGAHNISTSSGAQIDSLLYNTVTPNWNYNYSNSFSGANTTIGTLIFYGVSANAPGFTNVISGSTNNIGYLEMKADGDISGNNNTFGTVVFTPGFVYRFAPGTNNTINGNWFASGNPCYLTEIIRTNTSGVATITKHGSPVNLDYIRVNGITALGTASPFTAGEHSINLGANTNWNFAAYNPGAPIAGLGPDLILCPSLYPYTLNTSGFIGGPATTYTWMDGSTAPTFSVNGLGSYFVTVDYGRGCILTDTVTITDQFSIAFSNKAPVCDPTNPQGTVTALATGSSGPYTYSWNSAPVQSTAVLANVPAGTYTVTVIDDLGCVYSDSTIIVGPSTGNVFDVSIPAVTVFPDCDPSSVGTGSAIAVTTGGSTPYSLVWNTVPSQTTASIFNLNAGTYKIIATDANGCIDSAEVVILNQAGAFTGSVAVTNPTGCNLTGSGTVTVTGGLAPFSYVWTHSPSANTITESGIPLGNHSVTVVDDNSCIANLPFAIVSPDNIPPVIDGCPSNITVSNIIGSCDAVVSWTEPVATDACGILSLVSNHSPGDIFNVGSTNVVYTATDNLGNVSTCSFMVTVQDTEKPVFVVCPTDRVITATAGNCSASVNWAPPVATDNCGLVTVIGDFPSGATFPVGTTLVTYVATDAAGNKDTCDFKVIIRAHPSNFYFSSTYGNTTIYTSQQNPVVCGRNYTVPTPSVVNLCGNVFLVGGSYIPGQTYLMPIGLNTVALSYTNGADTITNTFTVNVIDNNSPYWTATTPSINLVADTCGGRRVSWTPPVPYDNCGIVSLTSNYSPGHLFPVGTTLVSYIATDPVGYTTQTNFNVIITDPAPVISGCPSNLVLTADTCTGRRVSWTPPTATDNCLTSFISNYSPGDLFPVGTTTVTYTAVSGNGAQTTCSFNVTVNPLLPTITTTCPSDITINLDAVTCDTVLTWTPPAFSHVCGIASVTSNYNAGDLFTPGIYTVTYIATSNDGFVQTCSFTIAVNAFATPITVTDCPADHPIYGSPWVTTQVDTTIFCGEAIAAWAAPSFSTSFCSNAVDTVIYTSSIALGDTVSVGQYGVFYEALDDLGNVLASCSFTFEVVDTISGVFAANCPTSPIVQYIDPSVYCGGVVASFQIPVFSSLGCAVAIDTIINNIDPGDTLSIGIHNVYYQAYDSTGSVIGGCYFDIEVLDTLSGLTITCPPTVFNPNWGQVYSVYMDTISCVAVADWPEPTFTSGGCTGVVDTVYSNYNVGDTLNLGSHYVYYSAYDSLGNYLGECNFTVLVTYPPEVIQWPADLTLYTNPSTCLATVNWTTPYAPSNYCGNSFYVDVNNHSNNWYPNGGNPYNPSSNQQLPAGVYTIQYYAYPNSNWAPVFHTFTVIILDGSVPSFGTTCPADTVLLTNNFNTCEATAAWQVPTAMLGTCASVMDPISVTSNYAPGDLLSVGNTDIIYTATTSGGVSATCSFVVEVIDTQDPVFYACPSDVNVTAGADSCFAVANWTAPGTFDNCPGLIVTSDYAPGASFPIGSTLVTYTATDVNGNTASCSFTVNVTDNVASVIAGCPTNITLNSDPSICGAIATWTPPTATDNCSLVSFTSTHTSGAVFPIGTTTVTYIATDAAGLNSYCTFTVTVVDNQVPVLLNCPSDMIVSANFNM